MVDRAFYGRSGGGITISGGEPGLRSAFCRQILSRCRSEGIHTAIETCGNCRWEDLEQIVEVADLVMMDIKLITPHRHANQDTRSNAPGRHSYVLCRK